MGDARLREIYNKYDEWKRDIKYTLPADERQFTTTVNGREVWVEPSGPTINMFYSDER